MKSQEDVKKKKMIWMKTMLIMKNYPKMREL